MITGPDGVLRPPILGLCRRHHLSQVFTCCAGQIASVLEVGAGLSDAPERDIYVEQGRFGQGVSCDARQIEGGLSGLIEVFRGGASLGCAASSISFE